MEEPWLRGPITGVDPLTAPILYAFQQTREDLGRFTAPLTIAQLWATPFGLGSAGFHILHIAGSIDRLMTYLQGQPLSASQMDALRAENSVTGLTRDHLLAKLEDALRAAEEIVRGIDPATLAEPRTVGRKGLPT